MVQEKSSIFDFRNKISTVDTKGKRKWMYVLPSKGKLTSLRYIFNTIYLILFFSMPFIKVNGKPFLQFDIIKAKFSIFGKVFLPQDAVIFGAGMLVFLLFIIVFTLIFGRVFCGWACPQTVFLEFVFRKIEYWIEGSAQKQQKANESKWTTEIYIRKTIKHVIFFIIAFLVANTFLSYIIGIDDLFQIMTEPISMHIGGFIAIMFFTVAFYCVFAFVREIVCAVICPYGRLQSVLLDKNSIVVAYDYNRGEPRGKSSRDTTEIKGDCIDCNLCFKVCPTGIDIRNGTQLECVNCTACIDACNVVMKKVNKPLNLIRYDTENNLEKNEKFQVTYRIKAYTAALIALIGVFVTLIVTREMFDATLLRVPGQSLQENTDGTISNLFRIKIVSKSYKTEPYKLEVNRLDAVIVYVGNHLDSLKSGVESEETFFVKIPKGNITKRKEKIKVNVISNGELILSKKVTFLGQY